MLSADFCDSIERAETEKPLPFFPLLPTENYE
jgi:hypothetical protein